MSDALPTFRLVRICEVCDGSMKPDQSDQGGLVEPYDIWACACGHVVDRISDPIAWTCSEVHILSIQGRLRAGRERTDSVSLSSQFTPKE